MSGTELCVGDIARIFDNSVSAAAVVSRDGDILYKNPACEKLPDGADGELSSIYSGTSFEKTVSWEKRCFRLCVTPLGGELCLVSIVPEREDYTCLLSAAVRHASFDMTLCLDKLSEQCSDSDSAELLDSLDGIRLTLLSEVFIPEELDILSGMASCDLNIVSISEAVRRFDDELGRETVFAPLFIPEGRSKITPGLYARVRESSLRLLLLDFISVCMEGEYCVEGIGVQLTRDPIDEIAVLELTCGFIGHKANIPLGRALRKPEGVSPADRLAEVLESKFGCEISRSGNSDFSVLRVKIPLAEPKGIDGVRAYRKMYGSSSDCSDVCAYLARHGINERYRKKKG